MNDYLDWTDEAPAADHGARMALHGAGAHPAGARQDSRWPSSPPRGCASGTRSWPSSRRGCAPARATKQRHREQNGDPDAIRARRATANRNLTVLKAALNHAWQGGRITGSDEAWRRVKPFRGADAARVRYLQIDECTRLLNACEPDFRRLVRGALVTGARYGELCRADVRDFNPDSASLLVRESKGGKPRHDPARR